MIFLTRTVHWLMNWNCSRGCACVAACAAAIGYFRPTDNEEQESRIAIVVAGEFEILNRGNDRIGIICDTGIEIARPPCVKYFSSRPGDARGRTTGATLTDRFVGFTAPGIEKTRIWLSEFKWLHQTLTPSRSAGQGISVSLLFFDADGLFSGPVLRASPFLDLPAQFDGKDSSNESLREKDYFLLR